MYLYAISINIRAIYFHNGFTYVHMCACAGRACFRAQVVHAITSWHLEQHWVRLDGIELLMYHLPDRCITHSTGQHLRAARHIA